MTSHIVIYTDGACSGNGQANAQGGWAAVLENDKRQLRISAGESDTTNQRMELKAAIEGLKAVRNDKAKIKIVTASKYLNDGCSKWLHVWKANGWKQSKGKLVQNRDLWEELDSLLMTLKVTCERLRRRNGHPLSELAAVLAVDAIGQGLKRTRGKAGETVE